MTTRTKTAATVTVGSVIIGLALLAIWFNQREPRNRDGYLYKDYLHYAGMSSEYGSLIFKDTEVDSFAIFMTGDTLVVEAPDTTYYFPGASPPAIPLPFYYTRKRTVGTVFMFGVLPEAFHSVYKFPADSTGKHLMEVWKGTEPGNTGELNLDSLDVSTVLPKDLIFGWTEKLPKDTVATYDSTGARVEYELSTFEPVEVTIYDTEENYFVTSDSLPPVLRTGKLLTTPAE